MTYVKLLSVGAVATMTFMAFIGASSASATVFCKTQLTSGCGAAGWDYGSGTTINMSLEESSVFEATKQEVVIPPVATCARGTMRLSTTSTGGSSETVGGTFEELSWSECSGQISVLSTGSLELHWISGSDNATVTGKGTEVTLKGGMLFGTCVYGTTAAGTHLGTLTGGNPATFKIEAVVPLIKDESVFGICQPHVLWTAAYSVTAPTPFYVATS